MSEHRNRSITIDTLQAIHRRAQQLLLFFIDGATPIDQEEPEWELFMAVRHVNGIPVLVLPPLSFLISTSFALTNNK